MRGTSRCSLGVAILLLALVPPVVANTYDYVVTVPFDDDDWDPGDGLCSIGNPFDPPVFCTLRAAVQEANAQPGQKTVFLPDGHYRLTRAGRDEDLAATGDLDVLDELWITGQSVERTIIDTDGIDRVFDLIGGSPSPVSVLIENATIQGGEALASTFPEGAGGGILVHGDVHFTLYNSRVVRNRAGWGAAIAVGQDGQLTVWASVISDNSIEPHTSGIFGGAIHVRSVNDQQGLEISQSTVANNRTPSGLAQTGGIDAYACTGVPSAVARLYNNTVSGNDGYGFSFRGCNAFVCQSTVVGNRVGLRFEELFPGSKYLQLVDSILANDEQDCSLISGGFITAGGLNLSSDTSCGLAPPIDIEGVDPLLLPLGYYGQTTPSHPPTWESPVIDAAFDSVFSNDQHGYPRPLMHYSDIGSIEVLPCVATNPDVHISSEILFSGTRQACRQLTAGTGVSIVGGPVSFFAREAIILDDGFSIAANTTFTASIVRTAGAPP